MDVRKYSQKPRVLFNSRPLLKIEDEEEEEAEEEEEEYRSRRMV